MWDITSHLPEKARKKKCRQGCGEKEISRIVSGNVHWYSCYENSMEVPQEIKNRTTMWSSNSTPGCLSKGNENTLKGTCEPVCSQQHYSQQPSHGCDLSVHQWVMGKTTLPHRPLFSLSHTHTQEHHSVIKKKKKKKEGKPAISRTWMNLKGITLSKISHKEKHSLFSL